MTYDLHGQWDYGNKWSSPGCPGGNCLRSHVNITETMNALTMITKAGMPSNKVIVGVSSYGRSFQMATPGCYTENCLFTGPASGAEKGRCTDTAGYISDFEINEIAKDPSKKATIIYDRASDSNIMYWNSNQWVAYMNEETKEKRTLGYQFATFGGISDWAIDLQREGAMFKQPAEPDLSPCDKEYTSVDAILRDRGKIPDYCVNQYLIWAMSIEIDDALAKYDELLGKAYDKKFEAYKRYIEQSAQESIDDYIFKYGSKHFTCKNRKIIICCKGCDGCRGNCEMDKPGQPCVSGRQISGTACPTDPEISEADSLKSPKSGSVWWTIKDEKAFKMGLMETNGIPPDWYTFKDHWRWTVGGCVGGTEDMGCQVYWHGYPVANAKIDVHNPKKIIGDALEKYKGFAYQLKWASYETLLDIYLGNPADVVTAAEIPVHMVQSAVDAMKKVQDIGEKIQKEERKQMILDFVMGALLVIPMLGEAVGVAGMTTLRTIIVGTGVAGDAAMALYSVVEDPKNAVIMLLTLLPMGRAFKDRAGGFKDAASAARKISQAERGAFGAAFKDRSAKIANMRGKCYR